MVDLNILGIAVEKRTARRGESLVAIIGQPAQLVHHSRVVRKRNITSDMDHGMYVSDSRTTELC